MPSYPTNNAGRRLAASERSPAARPSLPDIRRPVTPPKPANDNPRFPVPKPANDNPRAPRRSFRPIKPPLPGRLGRRLAKQLLPPPLRPIAEIAEAGLQRFLPPEYDMPPAPGAWYLSKGPHKYAAPYDGLPDRWRLAYLTGEGRITGQAISMNSSRPTLAEAIAAYPTREAHGWWIKANPGTRGAQFLAFQRGISPDPIKMPPLERVVPQPRWYVDPFILPPPAPGLDTFPSVIPQPLSPHKTNPNRRSQPEQKPGRPKEFPEPVTPPQPVQPRLPGLRPSQVPVWEVVTTTTPGQGVSPSRDPGQWPGQMPGRAPSPATSTAGSGVHNKRPPGPREKERKGRIAKGLWEALNAFGKFTEAQDMIDNAWKALPKNLRSKSFHKGKYVRPSWDKRAGDVLKHWRKVDLEQFVKNVIANEIEDQFIGRQSQLPGGRPNPGINQGRRENRENDPTQQMPFDADKLVDDIWNRLKEAAS